MEVDGGKVTIRSATNGVSPLNRQGFLRLEAEVRRLLHLRAGDRVLVVAHPDRRAMIVCPLSVLEDLVAPLFGATP